MFILKGTANFFFLFINSLLFPIKNFMIVSIDLYLFYCQTVRITVSLIFISYDPFNNLINNSFMNMFRSNAAFL